MQEHSFPYKLLQRQELVSRFNRLAAEGLPFLFIVDYRAEKGFVVEPDEFNERFLRFDFSGESALTESFSQKGNTPLIWAVKPSPFNEYHPKFTYIQQQISKGNSFLVNLTQPSEVETNLTIEELYESGKARYKLWLKDHFTVLSPEIFVRIKKNVISSYPMKGTIHASIPDAENIILNDQKEKAEHATIVDLIRNDLSMVADEVEVTRYRYVDRLMTNKGDLLQVSSEITGRLPDGFRTQLGDILFSLLPAGSICGAPKTKTLEIIEEVEGYTRDFYTGICGWFDGENLDSAVMIRFIEQKDDRLVFKSGGGITSQSDGQKEYEELIQKVYVPLR